MSARSSTFCVYVIRLDSKVLGRKRFSAANPLHQPGKPCVYVGMTGLTPEERFRKHKAGIKDGKYVRVFGLGLMPKRYKHLPRMTQADARKKEQELAERLRRRGYAVWWA